MDLQEAPAAATAQGDLADVVARAGAVMAAAAPPASTSHPPPSSLLAAADHMSSSSAAAVAAGQIMAVVPAYYDEEPAACSDAVMFDPYLPSSSATPRGGYSWLPPQQLGHQISQHSSCYAHDVAMAAGVATDVDGDEAMRIVSPAAHQIIKSRKNEVKKVVCIPALPPTSSRSGGGEVIPSDLWAWRKYGQKPIKGSPYPRGYYRCSSSKGCMARKQVERSRSDPNMLVITYTAEHNHPWPMQRNVLAGYSRPHTTSHTSTTSCKIKKNIIGRVSSPSPPSPSPSSSSKNNTDSEDHNNAVIAASGNDDLEWQQQTAYMLMDHQPMMSTQSTADEVFAELEELEPSSSNNNPASANIYSRGVSYDWHKF